MKEILDNPKEFFDNLSKEEFAKLLDKYGFEYKNTVDAEDNKCIYMIGDVFGNMWNGGDDFYANKGIVFQNKEIALNAMEELQDTYDSGYDWKLKLYKAKIIEID